MLELKEIFEMTTKQIEPDVGSWSEQEQRQRKANRGRRIGAFAVVAAMGLVAVAVVLGTGADPNGKAPEPGVNVPVDATPEEEIATRFADAYHALHADKAITYLADDADLSGLVGSLGSGGINGTTEGLPLFMSWLDAARYERASSRLGVTLSPEPCEEMPSASATAVRCPFHFHLLGSLEIGREPYGGSVLDLTVRDGEIVRAAMSWETDAFSPQMWEPFAEWVSAAHPDDAAVMYEDRTYSGVRLTEEAIGLWRQRIGEYVNGLAIDPQSADRNSRVVEGVEFSFTVPDAGWGAFGTTSINKSIVGPQGADAMIFWTSHPDGDDIKPDDADPCENLLAPSTPSPSAAGLAAAVSRAPGTELVAGPSVVTVGGYPAQHVVVRVREDLGCDPGYFYSWQTMWWGALWPETNVGDTIRVWIVDVGGARLWIEAETNEQADAKLEREVQQIVDSIRFD